MTRSSVHSSAAAASDTTGVEVLLPGSQIRPAAFILSLGFKFVARLRESPNLLRLSQGHESLPDPREPPCWDGLRQCASCSQHETSRAHLFNSLQNFRGHVILASVDDCAVLVDASRYRSIEDSSPLGETEIAKLRRPIYGVGRVIRILLQAKILAAHMKQIEGCTGLLCGV